MPPLEGTRTEPEFYAWTAASAFACPKLVFELEKKKNGGASPMDCKFLSEKLVGCHTKTVETLPDTPCMESLNEYKSCLQFGGNLKHTKCDELRINLQKCVAQNLGPFDE
mmetsp:Transcript_8475/g.11165  ORF Transcript_8475/g.11165 Transcript_8475/m.11165 type:complete len:110 (+) Transcript_8475:172-501(+)|eukprot:CAMPEP_0198137128 /NCGR_PEP_ID=MMETSP1443-20131203/668_1 /TAXON_ID=186043 /ORGANISM="Entomoneis sp., Strain CCMP2396" /LENGTH=109 /DNA_ID=CAMNT_0043798461 /DNA_START=152 /DNA_END=481 /DNA_ORIENTATION=+